LCAAHNLAKGIHQLRPSAAQFFTVMERQLHQDLFTPWRKFEQHFAPIVASTLPPDVPGTGEPVCEFDGAVMLDLQALREFADPGSNIRRQTLQRQHQLMLARLQTYGTHRLFAEREEIADFKAQFR
jgi:hypothetical protein